ncbi:MAG: type II/IV secretion system protein, partial [Janthinobacterium sp.]
MNQTSSVPMAPPAVAIDSALMQRARVLCRQSKRSLVEELQQLSGIDARQVVQELARPFGLAVLETADMLALAPAFDLLPLSLALARHSVLLRAADGQLVGVIADPFDLDLQTWLNARAGRGALSIRLALQADIGAYLSKQEESARAVDSLLPGA